MTDIDTNSYRAEIVAEAARRRDVYVTQVTQAVERMLLTFDIHLTTDRYNDLDDYLRNVIASIEENGQ